MTVPRGKIVPLSPSAADNSSGMSQAERRSQYKRESHASHNNRQSVGGSVVGDDREGRESSAQSRSEDIGVFRLTMIKLHRRASSRSWTILITVVTIYALFGDDIRLMAFDKDADWLFNLLSTLSLVIFAGELFVSSAADVQNRFSFYFWLDFIATVTMIPDIGWIWDPFLEAVVTGEGTDIGGVTRGLQASRVGSKSSRVVRIVRLVRLIRIAKLWKVHGQKRGESMADEVDEEPSMVGKKMSEMTMRRVITLVLTMLILLPFFEDTFYSEESAFIPTQLSHIHRMAQDYNVSRDQFNYYIQEFTRQNGRLVYLEICSDPTTECMRFNDDSSTSNNASSLGVSNYLPQAFIANIVKTTQYTDPESGGIVFENPGDPGYIPNDNWKDTYAGAIDAYRSTEFHLTNITACYTSTHQVSTTRTRCSAVAVFDVKEASVFSAMLNVLKTIFVIFVLGGGAASFTRDADVLVIAPIERMVQCVKTLAENPMGQGSDDDDDENTGGYETLLLERTIKKIGKLLQVGFGEAGSAIINKNMSSSGGVIDPMVKGQKVTAVFGFCDIRNFTDTTECLQAEVMVYVNKVGDIVHSATHAYCGAANKNIGDAFLLVWRIEDGNDGIQQATKAARAKKQVKATNGKKNKDSHQKIKPTASAFWSPSRRGNMCDNALVAFLKILVDLKRENLKGGCLYNYKHHPAILKRFGPSFEIKMGMGLHIGWAIEGAIGSHFKIDASYLSPNVNMSARLEAATKQFQTPLLLSHWFVEGLSSTARKRCRQIDCVTVKGSLEPMGIWTFDINTYPDFFADVDPNTGTSLSHVLEVEMAVLQAGVREEFNLLFSKGMNAYLEGDWSKAERFLRDALLQKDDVGDGPTESLLTVMQKLNFVAPEGWTGFRELTEK